jgi:hypothetical protein
MALNSLRGFCKQAFSWSRQAAYPLWSYQVTIDLDHFVIVVDHVQHQSAAAIAPRYRPSATVIAHTGSGMTFSDLLPRATDQKAGAGGGQAPLPVDKLPDHGNDHGPSQTSFMPFTRPSHLST